MADTSTSLGLSRRSMLAGLVAMPKLAATTVANTAQTGGPH
ncbi:hypothetical protein [Bradyrhizobium nanningense]|nr:hypothetical protein [Bradyrhizobium nanningense]